MNSGTLSRRNTSRSPSGSPSGDYFVPMPLTQAELESMANRVAQLTADRVTQPILNNMANLSDLQERYDALQRHNADLEKTCESLRSENASLKAENATLQTKVDDLINQPLKAVGEAQGTALELLKNATSQLEVAMQNPPTGEDSSLDNLKKIVEMAKLIIEGFKLSAETMKSEFEAKVKLPFDIKMSRFTFSVALFSVMVGLVGAILVYFTRKPCN